MRTKQQAIEYLISKQGATKEEYNGLTIVRYGQGEQVLSAIFHKSFRPLCHYRFKNEEGREEHITQQKKSHDITQMQSKLYAEQKKQEHDKIQAGSILYSSWGYDQTNIDFYKVVRRSGSLVELVEIGQHRERTEHDGGYTKPSDNVTSEPFKKRIGKYGVKINDYANAWLWDRERIGWSDGR